MSENDENRPADADLHEASRAAIERMRGDPNVQEVLGKLDALVATGQDAELGDLVPIPEPAEAAPEPAPEGAYAEHFESVRHGPSRKVDHEDKIIVQPKRTVGKVAQDAGIDLGEFQKLETGNQKARTLVAVRILDHLQQAYAEAPRTVGGRTVKLPQPDSVRGAAGVQVTDAGAIDPAVRTVGGGTIKGMPAPVGGLAGPGAVGAVAATAGEAPPPSSGAPGPVAPVVTPTRQPSRGPTRMVALMAIVGLATAAAVVTAFLLRPAESTTVGGETAASSQPAPLEPSATAPEPATSVAEPEASASAAAAEPSASAPTVAPPSARPPPTAVGPTGTTGPRPPVTTPPKTIPTHKPIFERR